MVCLRRLHPRHHPPEGFSLGGAESVTSDIGGLARGGGGGGVAGPPPPPGPGRLRVLDLLRHQRGHNEHRIISRIGLLLCE